MEIARDPARMLSLATITALCSIRPNLAPVTVKYALEQNFGEPAPGKPFFPGAIVEREEFRNGIMVQELRHLRTVPRVDPQAPCWLGASDSVSFR
jgi:hypothetical protein